MSIMARSEGIRCASLTTSSPLPVSATTSMLSIAPIIVRALFSTSGWSSAIRTLNTVSPASRPARYGLLMCLLLWLSSACAESGLPGLAQIDDVTNALPYEISRHSSYLLDPTLALTVEEIVAQERTFKRVHTMEPARITRSWCAIAHRATRAYGSTSPRPAISPRKAPKSPPSPSCFKGCSPC